MNKISVLIFALTLSFIGSCQDVEKRYLGNYFTINIQKNDTVYFKKLIPNIKNNKIEVLKNKLYYPEKDMVINMSVLDEIGVVKNEKIEFYEFSKKTNSWKHKEKMDFSIPNKVTNIQSVGPLTIALTKQNTTLIYEFDSFGEWIEQSKKKYISDKKVLLFDDTTLGLLENNIISFFDFKNGKWNKSDLIPNVNLEKKSKIISYGLLYIMTINGDNEIDLYLNEFPNWSIKKKLEIK